MNAIVVSNLYILIAIGGGMAILTLIQLFLAFRHDHAVAVAGPLAQIDALLVKIEELKASKLDYESEIDKFREKLSEHAEKMAETDALERKRDDLQTEWNTLQDKRNDVQSVREEAEQALQKREIVEADLREVNSQLDEIRSKLEGKEKLDSQLEALKQEKDEIDSQISKLREEAKDLTALSNREEELKGSVKELETTFAKMTGEADHKEERLKELDVNINQKNVSLAEINDEVIKKSAESEAKSVEVNRLKNEKERIAAEHEVLKALAEKERGGSTGGGTPGGDPLAGLNEKSPAIMDLEDWSESNITVEAEALKNVQKRFESLNLHYHQRVLSAYHTAMKTNETTQMAVLAGISGTGKSQLPKQYALGMGIGFLQVPVQPRWDSPQDLMGFYNYIERKFRPTDMARTLWSMDEQNNKENAIDDRMMLILLDEMNLARVEYYFSDFLSRLESRPSKENIERYTERKDAELELEIPNSKDGTHRIFPGYNLLFAGTMNEDESTQSLSDKVVDRANILRFAAPDEIFRSAPTETPMEPMALSRKTWDKWKKSELSSESERRVEQNITKMVQLMKSFNRPFGHRLGRAIKSYVVNYPIIEGDDSVNFALADQLEMRLLPKLRGVDTEENNSNFGELIQFVKEDLGDTSLAEAIEVSLERSELNGQFVWSGVTR